MKRYFSLAAILVLAVTLVPALSAQTSDQTSAANAPAAQPAPQQNTSQPQAAQASDTQMASSYVGTVVKTDDKYVLKTDSGTYQIDDQDRAKQFEGKQVKITGSLDSSTSSLQLSEIEPVTPE